MEVDGVMETGSIAEAIGSFFQTLDAAVHALGMAIVDLKHHGVTSTPYILRLKEEALRRFGGNSSISSLPYQ